MPSYVKLIYLGARVSENDTGILEHTYAEYDPEDFFGIKRVNEQVEFITLPKKYKRSNRPGHIYWVLKVEDRSQQIGKAGRIESDDLMQMYKVLDKEARMEHLATVFPRLGAIGARNNAVLVRAAMTLPEVYQADVISLITKR